MQSEAHSLWKCCLRGLGGLTFHGNQAGGLTLVVV